MYLSQIDMDMSLARWGMVDAALVPRTPRMATQVCLRIMVADFEVGLMKSGNSCSFRVPGTVCIFLVHDSTPPHYLLLMKSSHGRNMTIMSLNRHQGVVSRRVSLSSLEDRSHHRLASHWMAGAWLQ